jgi:tRNA A-37 threonylcarbamoyl transferase component Bud32
MYHQRVEWLDPVRRLAPAQRQRYLAARTAVLVRRTRIAFSMGLVLLAMHAALVQRDAADLSLIVPYAVAGVAVLGVIAATFTRSAARMVIALEVVAGTAVAAALALSGVPTGGFVSPYLPAVVVVWIVGVFFAPVPPRVFVPSVVVHIIGTLVLVGSLTAEPGNPLPVTWLFVAFGVFTSYGAVLRERAEVELFATSAQLQDLNAELSDRVDAQVAEIVRRAAEVDALNAQLQLKVQERSRELAAALRRLAESTPSASTALQPGDALGERLRIIALLGQGGMGAVYLAEDTVLRSQVAVKLMRSAHADRAALHRFLAEAEAAAAIPDPGVVKPLHVDITDDGRFYLIMEYVHGLALSRNLIATPGEAAQVGAALAGVLAASHAHGVVHRDVKPSNVLLCDDDPAVRVLDFGLAKIVDDEREALDASATGQLIGTPRYVSPEQIERPGEVGAATDVYSVGVILHELIAGAPPFVGKTIAEQLAAHLHMPTPRLTGASPALADAVASCLHKDPAARPTAAALAATLRACAGAAPSCASIARRAFADMLAATVDGTPQPGQLRHTRRS